MKRTLTIALVAVVVLTAGVAPAVAHEGGHSGATDSGTTDSGTTDECTNSDKGPSGDAGPPGFVADLVPNFISDLIGSLPVPNFVKSFFGASTC